MIIKGRNVRSTDRIRRKKFIIFLTIAAVLLLLCLASFVTGAWYQREGYLGDLHLSLTGLPNRIKAWFAAPEIPTIRIDMNFKNFLKIREKRAEAMKSGVLVSTNADFVPATLTVGDKTVKVRMRLKGDLTDHLLARKWSYRVKVRGNERLFGMRVFSLQHPRTKNWDVEWLYFQHLRHEGILCPRYFYIRAIFNGDDLGIYALEEHFSKELLESQKRREGVIVKFDETDFWRYRHKLSLSRMNDYKSQKLDVFGENRISRSPSLSSQRDAALQLLQGFVDEKLPASKVFKVRKLARFFALCELWSANHALRWHNIRLYYDPLEGRFEPIAFDAFQVQPAMASATSLKFDVLAVLEPWARQALEDPVVAGAYVEELIRVSQESFLAELCTSLTKQWEDVISTIHLEWPGLKSKIWEDLPEKQAYIRRVLEKDTLLRAYSYPAETSPSGKSGPNVIVRVGNIARLPVEILGFKIGVEQTVAPRKDSTEPVILPPKRCGEALEYSSFPLTVPPEGDMPISAIYRLVGTNNPRLIPVTNHSLRMPEAGRPDPPTLTDLLARHPFLKKTDEEGVLLIKKGDWAVEGDIIIPNGTALMAGPGTTLRFSQGAVLLCSGSVNFQGKRKAPVRLIPNQDTWAGLLVLNAPQSHWEYVDVEATSSIDRGGWTTTGGVTFYKSPVIFKNCRFIGSRGEDAVNVMNTRVECYECEFRTTSYDAFDGDFVTGIFEGCLFQDIKGDAVDVSGSAVRLNKLVMRNSGDKGISAGEESFVVATSIIIDGANIGVASKDLSKVDLTNSLIRNVKIAGLAAYVKKQEYGPSSIVARDVAMEAVPVKALVQTDSSISIDGLDIPEQNVDVEKLYDPDRPDR